MAHDAVVHLIDDDEGVRQGLAFLLTASGFAVRVYEFGRRLPRRPSGRATGLHRDRRQDAGNGRPRAAATAQRAANWPSGHRHDRPWRRAARGRGDEGGRGRFLEKPFNDEILLSAIKTAVNRHAEDARRRGEVAVIAERLASLSARESEVLDGLVAGRPNKTIAYDLAISVRTVEVHRAHVMAKMGASNLSELLRMAFLGRLSKND